MTVYNTGAPITVPVGEATLGQVFNVVGEPIDNKERCRKRKNLQFTNRLHHCWSKKLASMLETGIKVIDLIAPFAKGGKVGALAVQELAKRLLFKS